MHEYPNANHVKVKPYPQKNQQGILNSVQRIPR